VVDFATHGGQVGASLGVVTAFSPDSSCIKGEWQHVRHNTDGNFHASEFDSLMCACLSCNGSDTGGQLCPGSCGPQPPNAAANKICFSGPGNYTETKGHKNLNVVFRVDVEDHGEPGTADRYRIRIWFVEPDSTPGETLRQAVACADPTTEAVSSAVAPPDIDDGGILDTGNQQIHKSTGAKCK
jgi:hypothetical protein